jgi:hypothetical protein
MCLAVLKTPRGASTAASNLSTDSEYAYTSAFERMDKYGNMKKEMAKIMQK